MNRRKLNQEKSRNVPEPFSKELEDWMVGELKGVELSKRDKIVFPNVDLKRKLFQTSPPWCHSHWPKYSFSWEILKLKLQHEKSLLLRGEEKTKAATELQRVKSLGCSVYCHGWVTRVVIQCSDTGVHTCVCGRQCRAHGARTTLPQYGWCEDDCRTALKLLEILFVNLQEGSLAWDLPFFFFFFGP